jgi:hypothetical protein
MKKTYLFLMSFVFVSSSFAASQTEFNCEISYLEKIDGSNEVSIMAPLVVNLSESQSLPLPLTNISKKLDDGYIHFQIEEDNVSLNLNTPVLCLQNQEICIDDLQQSEVLTLNVGYGDPKIRAEAGFFISKNKKDRQYVHVSVDCTVRKKSSFSLFGN